MKIRAFLAAPMSPTVQAGAESLIRKLARQTTGVKWVAADQLHITLKFFGEIPIEAAHEISRAATRAVEPIEPFEIVVSGAGAFPANDRARTIWLAVGDGRQPLIELAQSIDERLTDLGYPPERRQFHPHVTIGRVRGKQHDSPLAELLGQLDDCYIGTSCVDELVLYSSQLERAGPVYTRVSTIKL